MGLLAVLIYKNILVSFWNILQFLELAWAGACVTIYNIKITYAVCSLVKIESVIVFKNHYGILWKFGYIWLIYQTHNKNNRMSCLPRFVVQSNMMKKHPRWFRINENLGEMLCLIADTNVKFVKTLYRSVKVVIFNLLWVFQRLEKFKHNCQFWLKITENTRNRTWNIDTAQTGNSVENSSVAGWFLTIHGSLWDS